VDLDGKTFNRDRLMDVLWDGRKVMMFTDEAENKNDSSLRRWRGRMVGKYWLTKETLRIVIASHLAATVPKGSIIEIQTDPLADDRTVVVCWNGKPMVMFVRDLAERSAKLTSDGSPVPVTAGLRKSSAPANSSVAPQDRRKSTSSLSRSSPASTLTLASKRWYVVSACRNKDLVLRVSR
jgi:hypothetical protein